MGVSARASKERPRAGKGTNRLILALVGVSLSVFVVGSFAFVYLLFFSATSPGSQGGLSNFPSSFPRIGGVPILSSPPSKNEKPAPGDSGSTKQPVPNHRVGFLLLGIDERDDEKGAPTRSDTMILMVVDEEKKRAAMVSLPRDMWVEIPGYADNRINVANFLGDAYHYPGGGPALAEKTVEHNFGVGVDYFARIDFRGFEKIVDTLGGVTVDVERAIKDDEYPTEDYGIMSIYIPAGVQHMNGKVALQYARSRHSENDFGRAKRQQRLLLAIRDRAMKLDVIPKLPSLIGTLMSMVQTDIPPAEFLRLARLAKDIGPENVSTLVIDEKLAPPFKGEGGADLLMPKKPEIRRAIAALLADPVIAEEAARIEVVNGTSKAGLATRTADYLMEQGYEVTKVSTGDRSDYKSTQIVVMGGKKGTAALLAETLNLGSQAVVSAPPSSAGSSSGPDIKVILGQDLDMP